MMYSVHMAVHTSQQQQQLKYIFSFEVAASRSRLPSARELTNVITFVLLIIIFSRSSVDITSKLLSSLLAKDSNRSDTQLAKANVLLVFAVPIGLVL